MLDGSAVEGPLDVAVDTKSGIVAVGPLEEGVVPEPGKSDE